MTYFKFCINIIFQFSCKVIILTKSFQSSNSINLLFQKLAPKNCSRLRSVLR